MKNYSLVQHLFAACVLLGLSSCAGEKPDAARPTEADQGRKSLSERLSEKNGYTQDAEGNWKVKSDKRSSYDSNRDSAYFKGKIDKSTYKTGDFKKKSWWGSKEYEKQQYAGNTDASRFKTQAKQEGQKSRFGGQNARETGLFKTNNLDRKSARESSFSALDRPTSETVEAARNRYVAPSVVDWREQRDMSVNQSRGILGR